MADVRQRTTWGIRFRFLVRVLGLVGMFAAAVGAVLPASAYPLWNSGTLGRLRTPRHERRGRFIHDCACSVLAHRPRRRGAGPRRRASWRAVPGGVAANRGRHHRSDRRARRHRARSSSSTLTRSRTIAATMSPAIGSSRFPRISPTNSANSARTSRPRSSCCRMHRTFGDASEVRDSYVSESEAKVAEKVKDLVDQFREFGPRFNVVVLDTEKFGYENATRRPHEECPGTEGRDRRGPGEQHLVPR